MSTASNENFENNFKRVLDKYVAVNAIYVSMLQTYTNPKLSTARETTPTFKIHLDINDLQQYEEAWVRVEQARYFEVLS